jgi:hypothetical protein
MRYREISCVLVAVVGMTLGMRTSVEAQGRGRGHGFRIPPGHVPAAGQCRIWYPGVPPGHQPSAVPCGALRGYRFVGGVVVETPRYGGGVRYWDEVWGGPRFRVDVVFRSDGDWRRDGVRIVAQWNRDFRASDRWDRVRDRRYDERSRGNRRRGR